MTLEEVQKRVQWLRDASGPGCDYEGLHSEEEDLYLDILKAIADSSSEFAPIAAEAIKTQDFDFPRWCG